MRRRALLGSLSAAVAIAALAAGGAAPASASRPVFARLSNERTLSRWAYPAFGSYIRTGPSFSARPLGTLQFLTSDGQAEIYLALASARIGSGRTWIQVEVPGRPNGRTGWVPREALGTLNVVHDYLLINRTTLTLTLFRGGRAIFSAPVGIGAPETETPAGNFYVMEKLITLDAPFYGPYAIGTSAYAPTLSEWPGGGIVGIHGTSEPQLIPGRPSHGCVRLRDGDIEHLWGTIELGTPIVIT